jgi:hypothetical protein
MARGTDTKAADGSTVRFSLFEKARGTAGGPLGLAFKQGGVE